MENPAHRIATGAKTRTLTNLCRYCVYFGFLLGLVPAHASVVYTSLSSWTSAIGSATTVTIPDPAPSAYIFFGANGSVTYSGVVFSANSTLGNGGLFNIGPLYSSDPAVITANEGSTGIDNILITFPQAVTGFAVDYGTYDGFPVTFKLSNGDNWTELVDTDLDFSTPNFFAVTDTSFTSVLVTSIDLELNINNISYGPIPTSPEPASFALVGFGLIAFSWWLSRRAKRTRQEQDRV